MVKSYEIPSIRHETSNNFDASEDNRILEMRFDPQAYGPQNANDEECLFNQPFLILSYKIQVITNTHVALWQSIGPHDMQTTLTNYNVNDFDFHKGVKNFTLCNGSDQMPNMHELTYSGKPIKVGTPYSQGDTVWWCINNITDASDKTYYARAYVEYKLLG